MPEASAERRCSFCGQRGSRDRRLFGGEPADACICAACVTAYKAVLDHDPQIGPADALHQRDRRLRRDNVTLQRNNALLREALNAIDEGIVTVSTSGEVLVANASAEWMFGTEIVPEPDWGETYGLFGLDGTTRLAPDEVPLIRAMRGELADNIGMVIRNERHPDGITTSVNIRPVRVRGTITGGIVVVRDLAGISAPKANLQRRTQIMETVVDSIAEGVIAADMNGDYLVYNRSAQQLIGPAIPSLELAHRPDKYGLYYPDGETLCPYDQLPLTRALRHNESTDDFDLLVRNEHCPDGVHIRISGRPLRDRAGAISGGVIIFRDVTMSVRTEDALLQAFSQGRQDVRETILHNIGNAINSVAIGTGTIREELQNNRPLRQLRALAKTAEAHRDDWISYLQHDPQGQRVLPFIIALTQQFVAQMERLHRTVTRISGRVSHIVDIIRTQRELGNVSPVYKAVDLEETIKEAVRVLQESLTKRTIHLQVECAAAKVLIQESGFHQMIVNLTKNAIEAIEEGGVAQAQIRIRAHVEGDLLFLDVIDNGIGLEPQSSRWLFAPGYTTKKNGSGLGLHSVANYVIGTGGSIRPLSDGIGHGTTMRIQLGLRRHRMPRAAERA